MDKAIAEMLQASSEALLVFENGILAGLSPEASRLFPDAAPGTEAAIIFGDLWEQTGPYEGQGSVLFSLEGESGSLNVKLTGLGGCVLATVYSDRQENRLLRTVAERMQHHLSSVMAVTPRLLSLLEEEQMESAAELNRGLYNLRRIGEELRAAGEKDSPFAYHPERVDLGEWLDRLAADLTPMCEMADRRLIYHSSAERAAAAMDREWMTSAVCQLVSNAIKFTEPQGEITLSLRRSGRLLRITVRDKGCGISADQMGRVYYRSINRGLIPDPRWGIGLGLPLARRVAAAHGGGLLLESSEGKGTAAHIYLPVSASGEPILKSPVTIPTGTNKFDMHREQLLTALSDVLPASAYDTRGLDL